MKDLIKTIIPWLKVSGYCAAGAVVGALFTAARLQHMSLEADDRCQVKVDAMQSDLDQYHQMDINLTLDNKRLVKLIQKHGLQP